MDIKIKTEYCLENKADQNTVLAVHNYVQQDVKYYDDEGKIKKISGTAVIDSITADEVAFYDYAEGRCTIPTEKLIGWTPIARDFHFINEETGEKISRYDPDKSILALIYYNDQGDIDVMTKVKVDAWSITATEATFYDPGSMERVTIPADRIIDWRTEDYYHRNVPMVQEEKMADRAEKKTGRLETLEKEAAQARSTLGKLSGYKKEASAQEYARSLEKYAGLADRAEKKTGRLEALEKEAAQACSTLGKLSGYKKEASAQEAEKREQGREYGKGHHESAHKQYETQK